MRRNPPLFRRTLSAKTTVPDFAKTPHFCLARQQLSTMDSLNHNARIEAIITVLESQGRVNYAATIKK
jgi:hypothetical protein